jgi:hypothetical protein
MINKPAQLVMMCEPDLKSSRLWGIDAHEGNFKHELPITDKRG